MSMRSYVISIVERLICLMLLVMTAFLGMAGSATAQSYSASGTATLDGTSSQAGVTIAFSRVSGTGAIPDSVLTDAAGAWSQSGFATGTTYRATPDKSEYIFSPDSRDFSDVSSGLDFNGWYISTTCVSVATGGTLGNNASFFSSISADGRYVAFSSGASNLVTGDTNATLDVFVHDRQSGETTRVSVASNGTEGNGSSGMPSISADGRYVAFTSGASNLVAGDTNGETDIFVHDRQSSETTRVSIATGGTEGNGHGGYPSTGSDYPSISADGRYVAFLSYAYNLVAGDYNAAGDVFVHDRQTGETFCISIATNGYTGNGDSLCPSISADGRFVAFSSRAANLVTGDTNGKGDVFVRDWQTNQTTRVSIAAGGAQGNGDSNPPSISADGRFVTFISSATNLVGNNATYTPPYHVYVHDRQLVQTSLVSVASDGTQANTGTLYSYSPAISADGRIVAFISEASNLVPGDTNGKKDVFVHDRLTGHTTRVNVASDGTQANADNGMTSEITPSISANGRYVAFNSYASNLVATDGNGANAIFVHDWGVEGSLQVNLSPPEAIAAGAQWHFIGETIWKNSETIISLPAGIYTILFKDGLDGWLTSGNQEVAVYRNELTAATGAYSGPHPIVIFQTDATPGSSLTGNTSQTVVQGGNCTPVTANVPVGYHFIKWTTGGMDYSTDNPLTVTSVTGSMMLTAVFARNQYSVTFQTDGTPGSSLTGVTSQTVLHGGNGTPVTANAPAGYAFVKWTKDGVYYSTSNPLTVTNVTGNMTLIAVFAIGHTITFQTDGTPGSSLTGNTSQTVVQGGNCTPVTVNVPVGYHFIKWTTGGVDYSTDNPLTVTSVTGSMTLTAVFARNQYTVTFQTDGTPGSSLTGNTSQTVVQGGNCTPVTANAPSGYVFVKWTLSGATSNPLTVTNVTWTQTLTAVFIQTFSVSGTVTLNGASNHSGVTVTFSRVSGSGEIPASVTTDASGAWSQTGFVPGTTYRATPDKANHYVFSPTYRNFSSASSVLNFSGWPISTTRVSIFSGGILDGNNSSTNPSISANGRFVAFRSYASSLVIGDTNGNPDIFAHDRQTSQTTRVSVSSSGAQGNGLSGSPSISADGRYVAFSSEASNLVANDTNGYSDIFVHDQQTGQTTRASIATGGTQGNGLSGSPSISADGRYVAFSSEASNLVANDTNGYSDIFVHDQQTGQTTRASIATGGAQGNGLSGSPSISADGRYVAFESSASNLVTDDTNGYSDIFVHDQQTGDTYRVSIATNGTQGNNDSLYPSISADGQIVAFSSGASNFATGDTNGYPDIFVHEQTGRTICITDTVIGPGNGFSLYPSISTDGRYVAFRSDASNLVASDTNGRSDAFVYDRRTHQRTRVSLASNGTEGNGSSSFSSSPSISADGRYVAFDSIANNLVANDWNPYFDVFVRDRGTAESWGSLPVTLGPPKAVVAGAQWRIVGRSIWNDSGATVSLPADNYLIEFKSGVAGWTAPSYQNVTVVESQSATTSGVYLRPSATISSTAPGTTATSPIPVTVTFGTALTDFDASELIPTNATISGFTGSGTTYTFNLVPRQPGTVSVSIAGSSPLSRTYTGPAMTVWVNFAWNGTEIGSQSQPFNTLAEGVAGVISGGVLKVQSGSTNEKPRITKALRIEAVGGVVRIGRP